jgi:prolyl-tRNA synthetase
LKAKKISVKYDDSDHARPGWKFNEYEMKGVPVRIAMGPRDIEQQVVEIARRDTKEKKSVPVEGLADYVENLLNEIQQNLYDRAKAYRDSHITEVNNWDEFVQVLNAKGGFVSAHWDGTPETEALIKEKTKATIRCIPLDAKQDPGVCVLSGKPSAGRVLFAQAY